MKRSEAIEIVREYYPSSGKDLNEALETLIPELKDSEDEKIRKALLNAFQESEDSLHMVLTPHRRESFIAWLEKQGSQQLATSAKTCKDEQKPAWSEDDDIKALNRISAILVDASEVKNWWKEYRLIERDEMIRLTDFLKSLKDRLQPQQKQEWSEDDEKVLGFILTDLELLLQMNRKSITLFNLEANWLKSLKERYTWKPSDEQIKALELAIGKYPLNGEVISILGKLYNDLKKLK